MFGRPSGAQPFRGHILANGGNVTILSAVVWGNAREAHAGDPATSIGLTKTKQRPPVPHAQSSGPGSRWLVSNIASEDGSRPRMLSMAPVG